LQLTPTYPTYMARHKNILTTITTDTLQKVSQDLGVFLDILTMLIYLQLYTNIHTYVTCVCV